MSLKTLTVVRRHCAPPQPHLGLVHVIPPMLLPDEAPSDGQGWHAQLGWEDPVQPGARVDVIDPVGLVAPSSFERAYLQWLSATLEAPLRAGWDTDEGAIDQAHDELRTALATTSPWADPTHIPDGVVLRRTATPRGEAVAAARRIREWLGDALGTLEGARQCDEVIVLLPGRPEDVSAWAAVLTEYDLPVRATIPTSVRDTAVAKWLLSLAGLAGWSEDHRRTRDALSAVLLSPMWSVTRAAEGLGAPPEARERLRRLMRQRLDGMRRPSCTVSEWAGLFGSPTDRDPAVTLDLAKALGRALADALAAGPGLLSRLSTLLLGKGKAFGLGTSGALRMLDDPMALAAFERVRGVLAQLREEERTAGGTHPEIGDAADPSGPLRALLIDRLAAAAVVQHLRPESGVTLLPYPSYDGRRSGMVFATGLGEGGFPSVPAIPNEAQRAWLPKVGGGQDPEAWIEREVERQLGLAAAAFGRCSGPVELSYARAAEDGRPVYPGALLSLLAGGWGDEEWAGKVGGPVEDLSWSDELPSKPEDACSWAEIAPLALDAKLPDANSVAGPQRDRLEALIAAVDGLDNAKSAKEQRAPEGETGEMIPGAYAGRLPGDSPIGKSFSPTALEAYGQCPSQYFFKRVLGLEDGAPADAEPDPMEMGTLVHAAFAEAAWQACSGATGLWDLGLDEDLDEDDARSRVRDIAAQASGGLRAKLGEHAAEAGISQGLVDRLADRWTQVIENWAQATVEEVPTADESSVDLAGPVANALNKAANARQDEPWIDRLVAQCETGECTSAKKAQDFKDVGALPKTLIGKKFGEWKKAADQDKAAVWESLRAEARQGVAKAEANAEEARAKERRRRSDGFRSKLAYAELAFGFDSDGTMDGADPGSVMGSFSLPTPDGPVLLRGEADRIDVDPARKQIAVRDYKTGKSKLSEAKLQRDLRAGRHLQLTLYTLAVEELAAAGRLPKLAGCSPRLIALEYPRKANPKRTGSGSTQLDLRADTGLTLAGERASWTDISQAWLAHHAAGIDGGRFDLLPSRCPKEHSDAYCDFDRVCGYEPGRRDGFAVDATAPTIAEVPAEDAPEETSDTTTTTPLEFLPLDVAPEAVDVAAARDRHRAAVKATADVSRDVVIAAGAGTGKTFNLVRRYLHALAAGASPQEILCVTFTRKAAAEMAHRVRAALLGEPDADLRDAVEAVRADEGRFRQIILTLSAAPISTIDSLALRIVEEHEGSAAEGLRVVEPPAVKGAISAYVTDAFLDRLEDDDPDLRVLLDAVSPSALRKHLVEAVKTWDGRQAPQTAETVQELWWSLTTPAADALQAGLRALDLSEWRRLFDDAQAQTAKVRRPNEAGAVLIAEALVAAAELRDGRSRTVGDRWRLIAPIAAFGAHNGIKGRVGKNELLAWTEANIGPLLERLGSVGKAAIAGATSGDAVGRWADVTSRALRLAADWGEGLGERLRSQNRWRYSDVEREALRILSDDGAAQAIAQRMPLKHVFVDESQDTNGVQTELIDRLVKATGARRLWVGDVKQSIYRFRGAEPDVFEARLTDPQGAAVVALTVNRRSSRPLIKSVNRMFASLLPARSGGAPIDPGSEVAFEALGWDTQRDADEDRPAIELLTQMGKRWHDPPARPTDDPEDEDEIAAGTATELAVVRRVHQWVDGVERRDERLPDVAILTHSWARADRYRDLLAQHGVTAAVQGGRGLLCTPEVDHLVLWLEAVVLRQPVAMLGALRGPGCALSDAGLYCLRKGYGLADDDGVDQVEGASIDWAARNGVLDADAAVASWAKASARVDIDEARRVLQADAAGLARFRRWWAQLDLALRRGRLIEGLRAFVDEAGLWSWWGGATSEARQRVANLRSFFGLAEEQAQLAPSPAAMVRRLLSMRDGEDPAAGGLDAGSEARVVITTLWQAKGREWPIVVLPDLEKWTESRESAGFHGWRLLLPDGDGRRARQVPGAIQTLPATPLEATSVKFVKDLAGAWSMATQRAELRRRLYVGMTRARQELLLSGVFDLPEANKAIPLPAHLPDPADGDRAKVFTLAIANDWATTLLAATQLSFDPEGNPSLGAGVWTSADVRLSRAAEVAADLAPPPEVNGPGDIEISVGTAARWAPVVSEPLAQLKPSELPEIAPPDTSVRMGHYPVDRPKHARALSATLEGTVLHGVMEAWGYSVDEPDAALVEEQIRLHAPGAPGDAASIAADLKVWVGQALAALPNLVVRLKAAAQRGDLLHEVPVSFRTADGTVEGSIDLLWKEDDGWHLLDYKWGVSKIPTANDRDVLKKHYAQVRCYADGFAAAAPSGEKLVDFGLWYPAIGLVLGWGA